jgi:hypothetical protein
MSFEKKVNPVQVQSFLKGVDYPAKKQELIQTARREGADQQVIATLERLPMEVFNSPNDVSEGIGRLR